MEHNAESIRTNGLIQPITVRPNSEGFEIIAGARRFRAAQIAELFSLPARIVDISDAETVLWQLVENSQRVDVHPYEEAQGFQRLLDMPGYDVATLVENPERARPTSTPVCLSCSWFRQLRRRSARNSSPHPTLTS